VQRNRAATYLEPSPSCADDARSGKGGSTPWILCCFCSDRELKKKKKKKEEEEEDETLRTYPLMFSVLFVPHLFLSLCSSSLFPLIIKVFQNSRFLGYITQDFLGYIICSVLKILVHNSL
jgi:hypothetical protein